MDPRQPSLRAAEKQRSELKLTQEEIQEGLTKLILDRPSRGRRAIQKVIPEALLTKYLVCGTEVFLREEPLLNIEITERCVVVGDLHGSFDDLMCICYYNDLPPNVHYVFLGDYIGRGNYRLDALLTVLLMKLRWPKHVHMLRGRHECTDTTQSDDFYNAIMDAYNSKKMYYLFAQLFDYIPLAAIINDEILCCHGGISQWMTSRDAIKELHRPTTLASTSVLEGCLIADILWADPMVLPDSENRLFTPSVRGASFCFSEEGLRAALNRMECRALIRSNADIAQGINEDIKSKCYTVYSAHGSPVGGQARGVCITLEVDANGNVEVDTSRDAMEVLTSSTESAGWSEYVYYFMKQRFPSDPCDYLADLSADSLHNHYAVDGLYGNQIVTHAHLTNWVLDFGMDALTDMKRDLHQLNIAPNAKYFPGHFPLLFDLVEGNGGTFRVQVNPAEEQFIRKPSPPIPFAQWPGKTWEEGRDTPEAIEASTDGSPHADASLEVSKSVRSPRQKSKSPRRRSARKRSSTVRRRLFQLPSINWRYVGVAASVVLLAWFVYWQRLPIRRVLARSYSKCGYYVIGPFRRLWRRIF